MLELITHSSKWVTHKILNKNTYIPITYTCNLPICSFVNFCWVTIIIKKEISIIGFVTCIMVYEDIRYIITS